VAGIAEVSKVHTCAKFKGEQEMITLHDIWQSSTNLLKRFDLIPSLDASWQKVIEEHQEMLEALYEMAAKDHKRNFLFRGHLAKEAGDLLVTLLNAAYSAGMTEDLLYEYDNLDALWNSLDTSTGSQKSRLIALSMAMYPLYVQLLDVHVGETSATLYGVSVYLSHCLKTLVCVIKGAGLSYEEFDAALDTVMFKNNNKTPENYEIVNGMITRRKPVIAEENLS
jgi:hypothetical protein